VPSNLLALAGRHNLLDVNEIGRILQVSSILIHPAYNTVTSENDVALLKVTNGQNLTYAKLDDGTYSEKLQSQALTIIG
jgi:hypothetical protein